MNSMPWVCPLSNSTSAATSNQTTSSATVRHPDLSGYDELAHVFDLKSSLWSAKATLQCALERRETRGCHNRADYPETEPALQVNMVWSADGTVTHEPMADVPADIAALIQEVF